MPTPPPPARVLVVDDEPGVLRAVRRVLERDYEVHCASTPAEALERAASFPPDLALLDVRMPGMDGFELRRRLAAGHPDLDVILMTGSLTEPDAHLIRAIEEGAFYFIQKPFDRRVLQTLVRRCLELRKFRSVARRELARPRRGRPPPCSGRPSTSCSGGGAAGAGPRRGKPRRSAWTPRGKSR